MALSASPAPTHSADALLSFFRAVIPTLDSNLHKGQNGRICIVGGSADYTGAPYYAAMSALRAGADLATVLSAPSAASALKAMAPELVVPACGLNPSDALLSRQHVFVIGPGLGRDAEAGACVLRLVRYATESCRPIVLDADALYFLAESAELRQVVRNAPKPAFILGTPNMPEMARLREAVGAAGDAELMAVFEGRLSLLCKGAEDVICAGEVRAIVGNEGSRKRAGGLGDCVAGVAGVFLLWTILAVGDKRVTGHEYQAAAVVAAAAVVRRASYHAFQKRLRSMVASDVLLEIGRTVVELEHGMLRAANT